MSSHITSEEYDPVANLHMQPVKGILKTGKSLDDAGQDAAKLAMSSANDCPTTSMTRSESKCHKIPHFDEMNILATYHPVDKDYGHMKIEEPKTPYAPNDIVDEENDSEPASGVDPNTLAQLLIESKQPGAAEPAHTYAYSPKRQSLDENAEHSSEYLEHRKQFEQHRKQHYNEFEVVRLRKKEIEDELRALEQEELKETPSSASNQSQGKGRGCETSSVSSSSNSIKLILIHHTNDSTPSSAHHHHHVYVEDDHEDEPKLTAEELERKKQFELKRKNHYDEFRTAHSNDKIDDDSQATE